MKITKRVFVCTPNRQRVDLFREQLDDDQVGGVICNHWERSRGAIEYRGVVDVERSLAQADADGLYRLLVARGVIADKTVAAPSAFAGVVAPLENIEMVTTPKAGAVLYDVKPGDRVRAGQRLATIVHAPGEKNGSLEIAAPQAGFVLTRRSIRVLPAGGDVIKLVGERRSADARTGALED